MDKLIKLTSTDNNIKSIISQNHNQLGSIRKNISNNKSLIKTHKEIFLPNSNTFECVRLINENIITFKVSSEFSLNDFDIYWNLIDEITSHLDKYFLIIDTSDIINDTSSSVREYNKNQIISRSSKLHHIAFVIRNPVIELVIKYIIRPNLEVPYSIERSLKRAVIETMKLQLDL